MNFDQYTQSGRTTRMLDQAVTMADLGRAVYVLTHTMEFAKVLQAKFREEYGRTSVKFETPGPEFDWTQMRYPRAHPNCVFLLDHMLAEQRAVRVQYEIAALQLQLSRLTAIATFGT